MFNALQHRLSQRQLGILLAFVGFTSYAFADTCVKWLVQDTSIYQAVFLNNGFACVFMLLASPWLGGIDSLWNVRYKKLHLLRGFLNVIIAVVIAKSFSLLPIADVYTFIFAVPFYAAILAIPLYKERVSRSRWVVIVIGFAGVLIALQPGGSGFDMTYLWPIGSGLLITLMFTVTKSMQGERLISMGFWPVLASFTCCGVLTFYEGFQPINLGSFLLFALNGGFIAIGILCVSNAFRMAPAAVVSPMLYTEMVWALIFGYALFGDVANMPMLIGAGVIILSGLYLIVSERGDNTKPQVSD